MTLEDPGESNVHRAGLPRASTASPTNTSKPSRHGIFRGQRDDPSRWQSRPWSKRGNSRIRAIMGEADDDHDDRYRGKIYLDLNLVC